MQPLKFSVVMEIGKTC